MNESIVHKLIIKKAFTYYPEDEILIKKILSFTSNKKPCVLDVGCGNGYYSFLFEKNGANVIGFDYNSQLIEEDRKKADLIGSSIKFLAADGNNPEKYFVDPVFDIIFMSGFSLFAKEISRPLMNNYLRLLTRNGILIFIQNSNLRGNVRKTHIRNYSIKHLTNEYLQLNCNIEKVYFYDRHVVIKIFRSYVFSDVSTILHKSLTLLTGLPCNIVMIISQKEK